MNKHVYVSAFAVICFGTVSLPSTADVSHNYNEMVTQTLPSQGTGNLIENIAKFDRLSGIKIIETRPELNPDKRKFAFSATQLKDILHEAGFRGEALKMAWAVAMQESTGRPYALNSSSNCYGLFQINMTGSMGPDRREKYGLSGNRDLFDPLTNAKIAYHMSAKGTNWSAWVNHKAIRQWLSEYPG